MKKINSILLIDDNPAENDFNQIIIEETGVTDNIHMVESGKEALHFLGNKIYILPELIFLDLTMPGMSGWEFLEEYQKLPRIKDAHIIMVILSNSSDPDIINRAQAIKAITSFQLKPLTAQGLNEITERYF